MKIDGLLLDNKTSFLNFILCAVFPHENAQRDCIFYSVFMTNTLSTTTRRSIHELSLTDLIQWVESIGYPSFRARQIYEWIWKKQVQDSSEMLNLPGALRDLIEKEFICFPLVQVRVEESEDQETSKFLWKLLDGSFVESVLIRAPGRYTVCVSSQVGCPARCGFCASGRKGLLRNLSSSEILCQVLAIDRVLQKSEGARVTNIVYMGMGEPMKNYDAVVRSIRALIDPSCFGISQRRITVSTVGVVEGIVAFAKEGLKVSLVLSLHAPNQKIRQKIIPYARQYPLEDVMEAMEFYHRTVLRDITYEYTLIHGINDSVDHARELCSLLKGRQCTVNLIPYNPVPGLTLQRPQRADIEAFREVLESYGIIHTCRYTKGVDIAAACGQLALQEEKEVVTIVPRSPLQQESRLVVV